MDAASLDGLATAFLAIDKDQAKRDFPTFPLDRVHGLEGRTASGDDVIDHDDVVAGFEIAFDLSAGAVAFGLFADGKNLECFRRIFYRGGHSDGKGNRVGTQRHAADGIYLELLGMNLRTHRMPTEVADEQGSEGIECGHAAVDVEIALFAGGEGETAGADRFLEQQFFQCGSDLEHGGSMGQKLKN